MVHFPEISILNPRVTLVRKISLFPYYTLCTWSLSLTHILLTQVLELVNLLEPSSSSRAITPPCRGWCTCSPCGCTWRRRCADLSRRHVGRGLGHVAGSQRSGAALASVAACAASVGHHSGGGSTRGSGARG